MLKTSRLNFSKAQSNLGLQLIAPEIVLGLNRPVRTTQSHRFGIS